MTENLERDKRSRAGHKTHVRRLITEAKELLEVFDKAKSEHRQKLTHYKTTIERKTDVINDLDKAILDGVKSEEIEAEIEDTSAFMDVINLTLIAVNEADEAGISAGNENGTVESPSQQQQPQNQESVQQVTSEQEIHNTSGLSVGSKVRARLPKLQLSTFDGKFTEWQSFWDNFESVIDSNEDLSEIDKFSYLRASLRGSAASAIKGFPLTGENYSGAVKLLKERYGDSQKIISTHMDLLINLPVISNGKDLQAIRQLSDDVEAHMRALESLGCKPEQYGELFLPLLMSKIPKEFRLEICSKVSEQSWNFNSVLKQLNEEIANRERCEFVAATKTSQEEHRFKGSRDHKRMEHKDPTTASTFTVGGDKEPVCIYCAQAHLSINCTVVTNINKRKEILKRSGRCYICTAKNHISKTCQSKGRCRNCEGRHHTSICQNHGMPKQRGLRHDAQSQTSDGKSNAAEEKKVENRATAEKSTTMHVDTRNSVLLQTATASIYRPDLPHRKRKARIILDGGSQRSYITERVKNEMNLMTSYSESLTIKPFGSSRGTTQVCDIVDLCINVDGENDVKLSATIN